jgi:hypothetical protein
VFVKFARLSLLVALAALCGIAFPGAEAAADAARKLPAFEMKDLTEREHRLTDEQFKGKRLLVAAFGTWQQASIDQARELEKFHKAHPDVMIIAFVVDSLPAARDFVQSEALTFQCYKTESTTRIDSTFNRLFKTRKGKTLTLNRVPFVMLADANRNVNFAELGLVTADELAKQLK